jgi:hypothetical protein
MLVEKFGEDSEPVSALLRFASIRVKDHKPKVGLIGWDEEKYAVRAYSVIPMAEESYDIWSKLKGNIGFIENYIIVSQSMGFNKSVHV